MQYQESHSDLAGTSAVSQLVVPEILVPKKQSSLSQQAGVVAGVFSAWKPFSGHGVFPVRFDDGNMDVNSNVAVSICEMTAQDSPLMGAAPMSVANVVPFSNPAPQRGGGVVVKVNIGWDNDLRFQLMYVWVNNQPD